MLKLIAVTLFAFASMGTPPNIKDSTTKTQFQYYDVQKLSEQKSTSHCYEWIPIDNEKPENPDILYK